MTSHHKTSPHITAQSELSQPLPLHLFMWVPRICAGKPRPHGNCHLALEWPCVPAHTSSPWASIGFATWYCSDLVWYRTPSPRQKGVLPPANGVALLASTPPPQSRSWFCHLPVERPVCQHTPSPCTSVGFATCHWSILVCERTPSPWHMLVLPPATRVALCASTPPSLSKCWFAACSCSRLQHLFQRGTTSSYTVYCMTANRDPPALAVAYDEGGCISFGHVGLR